MAPRVLAVPGLCERFVNGPPPRDLPIWQFEPRGYL